MNFTVHFLPSEITVEVPAGALISDAAVKAGLEDLHLPCGGKGTCGRCLVQVVEGHADQISQSHLDQALAEKGMVMACQTLVNDNLVVKLTKASESTMRVVGDSHLLVSEEYLPDRESFSTLYRTEMLTVPEASVEEHYSDWQRFVRELTKSTGPVQVNTDVWVLRGLAEALRAEDGKVTVVLQEEDASIRILNIKPGHIQLSAYGIAVDIGTTTVAVQLIDLNDGRVVASRTSYNAQIRRGADVISRIDYAKTPKRLLELRNLVLATINGLIDGISADAKMRPEDIRAAFIAGNTTMIHLLLVLPPKHIRETPYVPTVNSVPNLLAGEVGLRINSQAVVACAPGVGSYVGGDITSGLLCTDIPFNNEEVFLFLDIGTNGEIVLGNSDWMVACACSAGPAFEGSGIKCGMRAAEGAIEYIDISSDGKYVRYDVVGNTKPSGICGSGLICLLGDLFIKGIVDQSGRFNMELDTDRLVKLENSNAFVMEWGSNTADGHDLVITEPDIENLMRTKAAIFAACSLILGNVGLDWSVISKVYIAGGFGRYIQIEDAIVIGLLPDLPYDKFTYIGNSALTGAYIALLSGEKRQELSNIAGKMTYIDLSSDPRYMDSYVSALFLPHTDLTLFPTVAERLK